MATYTVELRTICENLAGKTEHVEYPQIDEVIAQVVDKIIPAYPAPNIADGESKQKAFNKKFLKHFWVREIGCETYGLWRLRLDQKLNEIMPYYNQLYEEAALLAGNPFDNVHLVTERSIKEDGVTNRAGNTETSKQGKGGRETGSTSDTTTTTDGSVNTTSSGKSDGTSTNSSDTNRTDTDRYSDTPQGGMENFGERLEDNEWITNARIVDSKQTSKDTGTTTANTSGTVNETSESNGTNKNKFNETENTANEESGSENYTSDTNRKNKIDYEQILSGRDGRFTYGKQIAEYRQTLINIDKMVLDELATLFMLVY